MIYPKEFIRFNRQLDNVHVFMMIPEIKHFDNESNDGNANSKNKWLYLLENNNFKIQTCIYTCTVHNVLMHL